MLGKIKIGEKEVEVIFLLTIVYVGYSIWNSYYLHKKMKVINEELAALLDSKQKNIT